MLPSPCYSVTRSISQEDRQVTSPFIARPLVDMCIMRSSDCRDGLHLWSKCQVIFDVALTDFNWSQFKSQMKTMAAQIDFRLFLNAFLPCLKIGTFMLIMAILINDNGRPGARDSSEVARCCPHTGIESFIWCLSSSPHLLPGLHKRGLLACGRARGANGLPRKAYTNNILHALINNTPMCGLPWGSLLLSSGV